MPLSPSLMTAFLASKFPTWNFVPSGHFGAEDSLGNSADRLELLKTGFPCLKTKLPFSASTELWAYAD
jgi:hypothetical protein